ncbi:hypothetical protein QM012_001444 [Aureobasidium pullulans]|uniref:Uncharacterized protein n=1 Tax=Aureobasidium pullulans TaxID=5580 RepID=A0ABR0TEN5_AURPU
MNVRLTLSDPSVKELAKASCVHEKYYDALTKLQEWNDNIRRTAVWRRRNESLLKAMRNGSAVDLAEFDGANAHQTYLGLKARYCISNNQRVQALYEEDLMLTTTELADAPRDIADSLQSAFNQYNQLVSRNVEQSLPENFLKMEFLMSLDSAYDDWRKELLKEQNVLALDQGSSLTFNELVDLVIIERARLLQEQTDNNASNSTVSSQQPLKRNISQVDEPAQPDLHKPRRSSPHNRGKHMDPHPESESEAENEVEEQISAGDGVYLSAKKETRDDNRATVENSRGDAVTAYYVEVNVQMEVVTAGRDPVNKRHSKECNPGTDGHHHIHIRDLNSEDHKRLQPNYQRYEGKLIIGPRGKAKIFKISRFGPSHRVTGRNLQIKLMQSRRKSYVVGMTFWGNGKMFVTLPAPVTSDPSGKALEFAGLQ